MLYNQRQINGSVGCPTHSRPFIAHKIRNHSTYTEHTALALRANDNRMNELDECGAIMHVVMG